MKRVILIGLLFFIGTLWSQKNKFTLEEQLMLDYPSQISVSPDGNYTAFTIRKTDFENTRWVSQLYLLNNKNGQIKQLTTHTSGVRNFAVSWESKFIYFVSKREFEGEYGKIVKGENQLWRIALDGGEAEFFLRLPNGVDEFVFSKNGKFLALLSDEEISDSLKRIQEQNEKTKNDEIVYPKENPKKEIWLYEFQSKKLKKIFKGDAGVSNIRFSANDNFILYQSNYTGEYNDEQNHDVFMLSLDGVSTQLTNFAGPETEPQTSPDEKYFSFISQTVPDIEFAETDIEIINFTTKERINLTKDFNLSIISYLWHPSEYKIFALVNEGVTTPLYVIDVSTRNVSKLVEGNFVLSNLNLTGDGTAYIIYEDASHLKEISTIEKNKIRLLTNYSSQLEKYHISPPGVFSFKTFDNKYSIQSLMVEPIDFDPAKKYPMILCVHGGPYSVFKQTFLQSYPMQVYANEGFVVIAPNVRGSAGYDDEFGQSNRYDLGGGDYKDAMSAVDFVIAKGFVDSTRMGVIGGSYGGYMTNWIISQTNRFSAAVSMYGIFSFFTDFSNSWQPVFEKMYFGYYYWERPIDQNHLWVNRSPAFYVQNITTPVLILQGDSDQYTNLANSQEMYQALKILGREVQFVVYPREGHGIRNEPQHYLNMLNRGLEWFKKYLKR